MEKPGVCLTKQGRRGVMFLDEGTHQLTLENGASLTVFASPYTPSLSRDGWGFQYHPSDGHEFAIGKDVDVVVTHGPPHGVMDRTEGKEKRRDANISLGPCIRLDHAYIASDTSTRAGGARLVTWRDVPNGAPDTFNAIEQDPQLSPVVEKLARLLPGRNDTGKVVEEKAARRTLYAAQRCCKTSHCADDEHPLVRDTHTLFVNASILGSEEWPVQKPWLVDIELPRAD